LTHVPASSRLSSWPYWFGATAVALCGGQAAYVWQSTPEPYVQFTVGGMTLRHGIKHADFSLLVGLVAAWAAAWLLFLLLERRVRRTEGEEGVEAARGLIAYATLPLVAWAASLFLSPSDNLDLVYLAAATVGIAVLLLAGATRRPAPPAGVTPLPLRDAAGLGALVTLFTTISALVAPFAVNRMLLLMRAEPVWTGQTPPVAFACAGAACGLIATWWAWLRPGRTRRRFAAALVAAQAALPWALLLALPLPWRAATGLVDSVPMGRALIIVFILIALCYGDLLRRAPAPAGAKANERADDAVRPLAMLSPLAIAAALLFLKQPSIAITQLHPDDYHHGEWLLPVWSLLRDGAVPFWDYVPARGLMNYDRGAVAALAFGAHTAAAIDAIGGFLTFAMCVLGLAALAPLIGLLPAALLLLPFPVANGVSEIDVVNTAGLAAMVLAYARYRASTWLVLWGAIGLAVFLWGPAQGSTVILATLPLVLWQLARAIRDERTQLRKTLLVALPAALLLLVATPLGRVVLGAVRYGTDHAAVAGPAHGIEWAASANMHGPLNRWLFEGIRTSFVAVPLIGMVLVAGALLASDEAGRERRKPLLLIGVPIVIVGVLFIYRAAGRIDPANVSRLGFASMWMLSLLLPLLLFAAWGRERWPVILAIGAAGGALLGTAFAPFDLAAVGRRGLDAPPRPPVNLVDGPGVGLPNLGVAPMEANHVNGIRKIQRVLNALLDKDETFLGLTERNGLYFYLDRTVPIESGALYNLPNDRQLLRVIDQLEAHRVAVVLATDGTEGVFDGGPASLRSHVVYRYLIWRYVPVRIDGLMFLVKPDRLARLDAHPELKVEKLDTLALLDRMFYMSDLQSLAASWGDSWPTLSRAAVEVRALPAGTLEQAEPLGGNRYRRAGTFPAMDWDFSSSPIAGKSAGLLVFDFACPTNDGAVPLYAFWAAPGAPFDMGQTFRFSGTNGRLVVPLDSAPRWLLAPAIGRLQVRLAAPDTCPEFSLSGATLWQRRIAAAADPK
jgi:hypothetical protein